MRKFLSFLMLSLMAVVGLSAKTLYLAPNDNWKSANARFAVYAFNDTENAWAGMTAVEGEDGLYQATVDDKYPTVIFCRMNGTTTENNWDNKWNQTGDETVPADKNLFTVTGDAWDNPASNWSTYTPATSGGEETSDAITLTFTYFDKADGDGSTKLSTVEAIFDAASQQYVSAVNVGTQVYAGRYYLVGEDTIKSNLKLGSSSAAGELKFTLADSVEVDSIVFRAAMYSASEGGDGFKVNGENFTLSAGKLVFEDKVWKPTGYVSTIDIVQNKASKGRFFLTAIIIYPKAAGEDPVTPPTPAAKDSIYFVNVAGWETPVVHLWGGTAAGTSWPGVAMIKLADQINNYDVYKYVADAGAYAHCIFSNNGANQTVDLDWTSGKYFYNGAWYELESIPAPAAPVKFRVVGDGEQFGNWSVENGLASYSDTLVMHLEAGNYKFKVVAGENWYGFTALTDTAAGLKELDKDKNIGFELKEASDVTVIFNASVFKLVGNFYVAPAADPTVAVIGSMTEWAQAIPFVLAEDKQSATFADTIPAGEYEFKMIINGEWRSNGWWFNRNVLGAANITENNDANMLLQADVTGFYTFTWYFANDSLAMEFPAAPVVIPAKYYITGDSALVGAELKWHPDAIKVMEDEYVFENLAAGDYKLKVTVDGDWATAKGYSDLTVKAEGLSADNDNNVNFTLAEAGNVTVVYNDSVFTVSGSFYVAPAADPTVAVIGSMTEWAQAIPFVLAEDKQSATFADTIPAGEYEFKMIINGEWRSNGWWFNRNVLGAANITGNDDANMLLQADVTGFYTFTWYFANDSLAMEFPAAPVVVPAKFYVTGDSALVVDAGLTADKAWASNAIKSEADTLVLNLKAEQAYKLKVTVDGTWASVKSFENLTDTAAGLTADNDGNICFTLAEAGEVQVIYTAELFKLVGSFYVAPAADPTAAVIGSMTEWAQAIPFVLAEDKQSATFADTIPAGEYELKMIINGDWRSNGGTIDREHPTAIVAGNVEANMTFVADTKGLYTFTWSFANDSFSVVYPEYVEPVAPDTTWYLVGDMTNWQEGKISFENGPIVANLTDEGRTYGFKVLKVIGDEKFWYGNAGTMTRENHENWVFETTIDANGMLIADVAGEYTFAMTLNEEGKPVVTVTYPEAPVIVPTLEDGYYLVGTMNEWTPAAEYKLAANTENKGEYYLERTFVAEEAFKVVAVANDAITTWYPGDGVADYTVDANHAGETRLYFRPDYQGGDDWYAACLYVIPTGTVDINNTNVDVKAVKMIKNGQFIIMKGDKTYNAQGVQVK